MPGLQETGTEDGINVSSLMCDRRDYLPKSLSVSTERGISRMRSEVKCTKGIAA